MTTRINRVNPKITKSCFKPYKSPVWAWNLYTPSRTSKITENTTILSQNFTENLPNLLLKLKLHNFTKIHPNPLLLDLNLACLCCSLLTLSWIPQICDPQATPQNPGLGPWRTDITACGIQSRHFGRVALVSPQTREFSPAILPTRWSCVSLDANAWHGLPWLGLP